MKLTSIFLVLIALSALFVVGCAAPSALNQVDVVDDTLSVDEEQITDFVEGDFVAEDEPVEIGELI